MTGYKASGLAAPVRSQGENVLVGQLLAGQPTKAEKTEPLTAASLPSPPYVSPHHLRFAPDSQRGTRDALGRRPTAS